MIAAIVWSGVAFGVASGVAILVRFARRARAGHRVRRLAGVRLGPVAATWGLATSGPARAAALGSVGGMAVAGVGGAAAAAVLGALAPPALRRRRRGARARLLDAQVPEMLRSIAAALRAGRSLPQALDAARDDASPPLLDALADATAPFAAGASVDEVLDDFEGRADVPSVRTAVETIRIGRTAGGDLPAVLDAAVEAMVERSRIARDRHAATSQARLSAFVVGSMPLAFFTMAGPTAREQLTFLVTEPVGWFVLTLGLLLQAGGALWMRALMRPR